MLVVVACLVAATLGFVSYAPNRLLSGAAIGVVPAMRLAASPGPAAVFGVTGLVLLASPFLPRRAAWEWAVILAAGGCAAAVLWLAGSYAEGMAAEGPAVARTSLGAACWVLLACTLLLAGDAAARLRLGPAGTLLAAAAIAGPATAVIAAGAVDQLSLAKEYANQRDIFFDAVVRHGEIVVAALLPTVLAGIPLGVATHRRRALRSVLFPVLNIIQTIPSIALFGLLMAPLSGLADALPWLAGLGISGIGMAPAVVALVLYSLLPVVRNTVAGLAGVPAPVREAALGMGMTPGQVFWRIDAPLALPVLLSGVRITAVQAVGLAAVAALIGAGGLGAIMFRGLFANALDLVLLGAIPVILLAVLVDLLMRLLIALTTRRGA
nr:ABC transporter permease [Limobrevibacterium gyesilva]